jgi:hypothetical protein
MLSSVYILYKKRMSLKFKYNQFRLVVADELLDGLKMLEYARQGHAVADTPLRLQAFYWAHFSQYILPNPVKANP